MGLDSLPPAAASARLQPPLVKTIPAVTAMVWGSGGSDGLGWKWWLWWWWRGGGQ